MLLLLVTQLVEKFMVCLLEQVLSYGVFVFVREARMLPSLFEY